MTDRAESEPTLDAEQEYARRKSAEREAYQRKRQQAETRWAQEKRWKESWKLLEGSLGTWASGRNSYSAIDVATAVVALARDLREFGFEEHTREAVRRLDRLHQKDSAGEAVNLCDLHEVRIICRWILHAMEGVDAADIAKRVENLSPSGDFARATEPASFEIMYAPQLDLADAAPNKMESERSLKWKQFACRFREVLSNNAGKEHPAYEIKEICVEAAIAMSQVSPDGKSWLAAPSVMQKYRQPPKPDDWDSWGHIWHLGLHHFLASYPFPQELPAHLVTYNPWRNETVAWDNDWRAGVQRFAEFCDWQMRRAREEDAQRRLQDTVSTTQETVERCTSRLAQCGELTPYPLRDLTMKDFFISYNGTDKQWAEWIAWTLEEAGYTTVIQAWDFRAGGDFVMEMQRAATGTERTIAVVSENYLSAEYTQPEWGNAFARDPKGRERTLIPVRIAECQPSGLLATRIYIDLVGLSENESRNKLLESLKDRGKPDSSPAFPGIGDPLAPATEHPPQSFPGRASTAVAVWQEKLDYLQQQEAITSDHAQKFSLKKLIDEAQQKIQELSRNP